MAVVQQPDAQTGEVTENASLEAENCLEIIDLVAGFDPNCLADLPLASYPTPENSQNSFQDDFQPTVYGSIKFTRDPPMSFRDRHRLLDGIYNSYPDPTLVMAEDMGEIALKVGLFMEEVLAWFMDEKSRRAELANNRPQIQVPTCRFPPSPESIRGLREVSSASSLYNSTSPATPSQPLDVLSPRSIPSEDKKMLAPPKPKRGRPPKMHIKTESEHSSPDSKRKRISIKYPCVDCRNFASSERYAEHINRTHFPESVWECPKTNPNTGKPCMNSTTNPNYRPFYRIDNFANHLRAEHRCSNSEVDELKNSCKFEVFDFFHKICGFCDKALESRDESIKHIKEHFRNASQEPDPPTDLGVSLWKEKCVSEHRLQIGVHYRRSQASIPDLMSVDHGHDHDGHDGENGGLGGGSSERDSNNSNHDSSNSPSNSSAHDRGDDMGGYSGEGCSDSQTCDNLDHQSDDTNHSHGCEHSEDEPSGEDCSDVSNYKHSLDASFYQCQNSPLVSPKIECSESQDLVFISSLPFPSYDDMRPDSQEHTATRSEFHDEWTGLRTIARTRQPRKFTTKEDANFQCHVKGCGKLFGRSYNFKAHMETHASHEYPFPCPLKDCDKKFVRKTDLQRHHQSVHMKQRNHRCDYSSRYFAREDTLRKHMLDGCSKRSGDKSHEKILLHKYAHDMLSLTADDNKDMDFPLYPDPQNVFSQSFPFSNPPSSTTDAFSYPKSQKGFPASSATFYTEAPSYLEHLDRRSPSGYSIASEPSAESSAAGFHSSIQSHTVPVPEWAPTDLGIIPSIVGHDYFPDYLSNEHKFTPSDTENFDLNFNAAKPNGFVDPSILHPEHSSHPISMTESNDKFYPFPPPTSASHEPTSAARSNCISRSYQSPYLTARQPTSTESNHSSCPYPSPRRPSLLSHCNQDSFSSENSKEKGRCTYPECGKMFKDLKAHMLVHQSHRPEKCPIPTCGYHIKGFARKYDKNRHILTHYKGTMVCGFCPGNGSAAEKSFNRADVFKRHLTSAHGVEQTPPNSRKKTSAVDNVNSAKKLSGHVVDVTGKCSTCSETFNNAQDFYEHLDDCVLRIVQQEDPSEPINAARLAEVENDQSVHETLLRNTLPTAVNAYSDENKDGGRDIEPTDTAHGTPISGRKKRKDYPLSWGSPASQMKLKKRVLCVFDGPRRLWKDDMMPDTEQEVRGKPSDEDIYVTDLDVETM